MKRKRYFERCGKNWWCKWEEWMMAWRSNRNLKGTKMIFHWYLSVWCPDIKQTWFIGIAAFLLMR